MKGPKDVIVKVQVTALCGSYVQLFIVYTLLLCLLGVPAVAVAIPPLKPVFLREMTLS